MPGRHSLTERGMHSTGEKVLSAQQDEQARHALQRALSELMTGNELQGNVDRNNRRRFRVNLSKAIVDVRGLVRMQ